MRTARHETERVNPARRRARAHGAPGSPTFTLALAAALVAGGATARANIRAPILEPQPASSTAHLLAPPGDLLLILGENLTFRCGSVACDVEARYRIKARDAIITQLAFVLPQAVPLSVRVGTPSATVDAPVSLAASAQEPVAEEEIRPEATILANRNLVAVQARFTAAFVPGDNVVIVRYMQPLGRRESGRGYFRHGRFVDFFRYELWPLAEWKHAPGFHIDGEVVIARSKPSLWSRLFLLLRSVGCRAPEALSHAFLEQRDNELHLVFQIFDPIPRRLWCEIGDDDLVPPS
jgi:hypothetical protein